VWETSCPEEVAAKFCKKHGLPSGVASALEHKIGENIKDLMAERKSHKSKEELDIRGQINPDKDGRDMKAKPVFSKQDGPEKDLSPSSHSNSQLVPSMPSKKANSAEGDLVIEFPESKKEHDHKFNQSKDLKRNKSERSFNNEKKMSSSGQEYNKRMMPTGGFREFDPQDNAGVYHRLQQDVKKQSHKTKVSSCKRGTK